MNTDQKRKIYVITAGSYSDYHICGVTLDYEKAKEMQKRYWGSRYDEACIEEYTEDEYSADGFLLGTTVVPVWNVRFDRQGNAFSTKLAYYTDKPGERKLTTDGIRFIDLCTSLDPKHFSSLSNFDIASFFIAGPDPKTAEKIACDLRAQILALICGI